MLLKIILGAFTGGLLGYLLKYVNDTFEFMFLPYFVIMPLCILLGAGIGLAVSINKINGIIMGTVTGGLLGYLLECVNAVFTFMLPPCLVIMPLCILLGAGIGLAVSFNGKVVQAAQ